MLDGSTYALYSERGPWGGGTLEGPADALRFGGDPEAPCTEPATYTAQREGDGLVLRTSDDPCDEIRGLAETAGADVVGTDDLAARSGPTRPHVIEGEFERRDH